MEYFSSKTELHNMERKLKNLIEEKMNHSIKESKNTPVGKSIQSLDD